MEVVQEHIRYDSRLVGARMLDIHKSGTSHASRWHIHEEMELILVMQGCLVMEVHNASYLVKSGDVLMIGPNELHRSVKQQGDVHYWVLQFDVKHYLDKSALACLPCFHNPVKPMSAYNGRLMEQRLLRNELTEHMQRIHQELNLQSFGYEMAVSLHIGGMLLELLRMDPAMQQPEQLLILERLRPAIDYIEAHLAGKITAVEVCRQVNLSYERTAHLFKQALGMSIIPYVNYKRIKKAEVLLAAGAMTVAETARAVGIENLAHFTELFKRWNRITPRAFQQLAQGRGEAELSKE